MTPQDAVEPGQAPRPGGTDAPDGEREVLGDLPVVRAVLPEEAGEEDPATGREFNQSIPDGRRALFIGEKLVGGGIRRLDVPGQGLRFPPGPPEFPEGHPAGGDHQPSGERPGIPDGPAMLEEGGPDRLAHVRRFFPRKPHPERGSEDQGSIAGDEPGPGLLVPAERSS